MFLLNSRYPLLFYAKKHSFSLSYRVNLPSSLTFFLLFAFIYSTRLHVFEFGTVLYIDFFQPILPFQIITILII